MIFTMYSGARSLLKYLIFFLIYGATICYPIDKLNEIKSPLKDEIRYPNGTVVGKYTYFDKKGNPVHVKYYADNSSYGVELKTIKLDFNSEESSWTATNFDVMKPMEPPLGLKLEIPSVFNPEPKINWNQNTNMNQMNYNYNNKKKDTKRQMKEKLSDYESFYQNVIKTPRQCEKNKIRVYLDKEKKLIKRALDNVAKYCG